MAVEVFVVAAVERVYTEELLVGRAEMVVPDAIPGPRIGVPTVRAPNSMLATVSDVPLTEPLKVAQGGTALTETPFVFMALAARPIAIPGYITGFARVLELAVYTSAEYEVKVREYCVAGVIIFITSRIYRPKLSRVIVPIIFIEFMVIAEYELGNVVVDRILRV